MRGKTAPHLRYGLEEYKKEPAGRLNGRLASSILRLSNGDLKAVQGDGGWSTLDMVTKRYAHILDEDRRSIASQMEELLS